MRPAILTRGQEAVNDPTNTAHVVPDMRYHGLGGRITMGFADPRRDCGVGRVSAVVIDGRAGGLSNGNPGTTASARGKQSALREGEFPQ